MSVLKRAIIYLKRNLFHSIVLLLIIFLLGTISLGAVSAYRMMNRTEENLWASLPAVVTIDEDVMASELHFQSYGNWPVPDITRELFDEISQLPYVGTADFSLKHHMHSRNLNRYWDLTTNVRDDQSLRKCKKITCYS